MNTNNNRQNSRINMQPMTISQTVQVVQDYQVPQTSSVSPQENIVMVEYSFFYKAHNDFQIYHITCEETSFEVVSRLLRDHDCLVQNNVQPNNSHVFYYQQPDDKKIYKVVCKVVSYTYIICTVC